MNRLPELLTSLCVVLVCASSAHAAVVFDFTYVDDDGTGFNAEGNTGQQRRDSLELAANIFGSSALRNYSGTVEMVAIGVFPPLAAAVSDLTRANPVGGGFGRTEVVRNKVLSNGAVDLNGGNPDGLMLVNFDQTSWQFDPTVTPGPSEYDFYSTIYHELTHTLGWTYLIEDVSFGAVSGQDRFGDGTSVADGGTGQAGEWSKFDEFLADADGNRIIDPATLLTTDADVWNELQTGGASPDDGLFFAGPNALAANGGAPVGLYTPESFASGSSIAHLDDDNPQFDGMMMLSGIQTGPTSREYSEIELGVLMDLGFTGISQISAIPEPASPLILAVCCGYFFGQARRRRGPSPHPSCGSPTIA